VTGGSVHRIRLERGTTASVQVGAEVRPDEVVAVRRRPLPPIRIPIADPLRRRADGIDDVLTVQAGSQVEAGERLAAAGSHEVTAPVGGLVLAISHLDGTILLAPFGPEEPVVGHVRGKIRGIDHDAITIDVPAARLRGVGGTGDAVHGQLALSVQNPDEELRAAAIDVAATGKILVGGSRASAETLTRARAMGVAGIVLGGILDKELRDFEAIQRRRREAGGLTASFGLLVLEGFGKVGIDPQVFGWLRSQIGRMASLFGSERLLYVYDAGAAPSRRPLPRVGDRVVSHGRPYQGRGGVVVSLLEELHATASGIPTRMAVVRFEDGRLAAMPLANIEATVRPEDR